MSFVTTDRLWLTPETAAGVISVAKEDSNKPGGVPNKINALRVTNLDLGGKFVLGRPEKMLS